MSDSSYVVDSRYLNQDESNRIIEKLASLVGKPFCFYDASMKDISSRYMVPFCSRERYTIECVIHRSSQGYVGVKWSNGNLGGQNSWTYPLYNFKHLLNFTFKPKKDLSF